MKINYEEIEQATSKKFVEFIQSQLSNNTMWKHFEIDNTERWYCINAIDCHIESIGCTYFAYNFIFDKNDKAFFKQYTSSSVIKEMIKKGWFDDTISK